MTADSRPLVLHVVYRFDVGGLENGLVNIINQMSGDYRHAIVALTEASAFRHRIKRADVQISALQKSPGHGFWLYPELFRLMRAWRPAIVHTRNLAALEAVIPAWLAGVPVRIHGEHGRDVDDLDGKSRKHRTLRRLYRRFVSHYVAVSGELANYLVADVGVDRSDVSRITNGVDTASFIPAQGGATRIDGCPFGGRHHWLVGTVGRMQPVKDQLTLAHAFVLVLRRQPAFRERARLIMIGDGPLRAASMSVLRAGGASDLAWLPGERDDISTIMRGLNCFVLPSLAEGISNTILEAMASGLPVIATDVGGNAELVSRGETGEIVPPADVEALADSIAKLMTQPELATAMGRAGRIAAETRFSLSAMASAYERLYDEQLEVKGFARFTQMRRS